MQTKTSDGTSIMFCDLSRRMFDMHVEHVAKSDNSAYFFRWNVMRKNAIPGYAQYANPVGAEKDVFFPVIVNKNNSKLLMIGHKKLTTKEDAIYEAKLLLLTAQMSVLN